MMTKEEVAAIVSYCQENKVSFKQRLAELGIQEWTFYESKRKYAPKEVGEKAGGAVAGLYGENRVLLDEPSVGGISAKGPCQTCGKVRGVGCTV